MIEILLETLLFVTVVPFTENWIFPTLISAVFIYSLYTATRINANRRKEYIEDFDKLIYEDYHEIILSNSTPGILMSIGIIGTFYLIYSSLHGLHNNIEIKDMLTVIKLNIAPAFSVSAFGIMASIIYSGIEKLIVVRKHYKSMQKIADTNKTLTYSDIQIAHLNNSDKSLTAMKELSEVFSSLKSFSDSLGGMTESMQKFGNIANKLEDTLNPEVLGNVISQALLKDISPILNDIHNINKNVNENSNQIKEFLEKDLKDEIIIPLKKSVDDTSSSMKQIENALMQTSSAMLETNKGFDKLNESLDKLDNAQHTFVEKLDNVLEKQKHEFEQTTKIINSTYLQLSETVTNQINKFNENSKDITDSFTGLSKEMQEFLIGYKQDYKELLENQEKAIEQTTSKAIETLDSSKNMIENAGQEASNVIIRASEQIGNTLTGVDDALVKTSASIKDELEKFKDSYTDSLKGFLNSQEEILNSVFKEQTERLAGVVNSFRENLENDVQNRKTLNEDLEKLIKTTDGFVAQTKAMITTAFDEQQKQLIHFMQNNEQMQSSLTNIIASSENLSVKGAETTKELIDNVANLSKQFNDNQSEILKTYQIKVDDHLKDILNYMAAIIEASHINSDK